MVGEPNACLTFAEILYHQTVQKSRLLSVFSVSVSTLGTLSDKAHCPCTGMHDAQPACKQDSGNDQGADQYPAANIHPLRKRVAAWAVKHYSRG